MKNPYDDDVKELENGEEHKFEGYTRKLGRARWSVGAERGKNGVIKTLYLIPDQQPGNPPILKYKPHNEHVSYRVDAELSIKRSKQSTDRVRHSRCIYCATHDLVEDDFVMPASAGKLSIKEYGSGILVRVER